MGDARVAAAAKKIAYRLDPHAVVDPAAKAETERTVTIRPAPDTMTYLTALLPVAQGVSVYAALVEQRTPRSTIQPAGRSWPTRSSNAPPVAVRRRRRRSRSTWCSRTPRCSAMTPRRRVSAATDRSPPKWLVSWYRPPLLTQSRARRCGGCTPSSVRCTGGYGVTSPELSDRMATFIGLRDERCRTPYCDAPIRHRDHATPHARGGPTTADNGLGLCERCNYVKEAAGWQVHTHIDETGRHTAE